MSLRVHSVDDPVLEFGWASQLISGFVKNLHDHVPLRNRNHFPQLFVGNAVVGPLELLAEQLHWADKVRDQ